MKNNNESWNYSLPKKALMKWARENVILDHFEDGIVEAQFRYIGSTCGNMGHTIDFDFRVKLSPFSDGHKVLATSCKPADQDRGATQMCAYISDPEQFLARVDDYQPRLGEPLEACAQWNPQIMPAGCLCNIQSRNHKWRNAFQTIHYALTLKEEVSNGETQNQ